MIVQFPHSEPMGNSKDDNLNEAPQNLENTVCFHARESDVVCPLHVIVLSISLQQEISF